MKCGLYKCDGPKLQYLNPDLQCLYLVCLKRYHRNSLDSRPEPTPSLPQPQTAPLIGKSRAQPVSVVVLEIQECLRTTRFLLGGVNGVLFYQVGQFNCILKASEHLLLLCLLSTRAAWYLASVMQLALSFQLPPACRTLQWHQTEIRISYPNSSIDSSIRRECSPLPPAPLCLTRGLHSPSAATHTGTAEAEGIKPAWILGDVGTQRQNCCVQERLEH